MADKVRYFLEQAVPELEDLQSKGLFTKSEITMVMRRRTDFEHRIHGRGAKPRDFLRYGDFEANLEKLRLKRYTRLERANAIDTTRTISDWAGPQRLIYIFDRATRRFPSDNELWATYLKTAKDQGAVKVIYQVYAKLLVLQPRNVEAWLLAAKYEFEQNTNAKGARMLFQRGLRLNPESTRLWLNYAQFELTYVSKLLARRKLLGLITEKEQQDELDREATERRKPEDDDGEELDDMNRDLVELPMTSELNSTLNNLPEAEMNVLGNPESNPVLRGDVALTVFDVCIPTLRKSFPEGWDQEKKDNRIFALVEEFLALFDKFENLDQDRLYLHALVFLQREYASNLKTVMVDVTLPIRTVTVTDGSLAENLQLSVKKFLAYKKKSSEKEELTRMYAKYLKERFVENAEGASERTVSLLQAIIKKCEA